MGWLSPPSRAAAIVGALALSTIGIWLLGSIATRSTRAEFVDQASLAATLLGFAVAVIAFLAAAEQVHLANTPPALEIRWRRPPDLERIRGGAEGSNVTLHYSLHNAGPGAAVIYSLTLRPTLETISTHATQRRPLGAQTPFRVALSGSSPVSDGSLLEWNLEYPNVFFIATPTIHAGRLASIDAGQTIDLPPLSMWVDDNVGVSALREIGPLRFHFPFHIQTEKKFYMQDVLIDLPLTSADTASPAPQSPPPS